MDEKNTDDMTLDHATDITIHRLSNEVLDQFMSKLMAMTPDNRYEYLSNLKGVDRVNPYGKEFKQVQEEDIPKLYKRYQQIKKLKGISEEESDNDKEEDNKN